MTFSVLQASFSQTHLLFPPGNDIWADFEDFVNVSGLSGCLVAVGSRPF